MEVIKNKMMQHVYIYFQMQMMLTYIDSFENLILYLTTSIKSTIVSEHFFEILDNMLMEIFYYYKPQKEKAVYGH